MTDFSWHVSGTEGGELVSLPILVVVNGTGGSGKTTLAHRLAKTIGCPAICRDEIKEGMAHANPGFLPEAGDPLTLRTLTVFFGVLEILLQGGVTVVAEAGFQDRVWRPWLERLRGLADLRIVLCTVDPDIAVERMTQRLAEPQRATHADLEWLRERSRTIDSFVPVSLDVPTLRVDTTSGYQPPLDDVVAFAAQPPLVRP